MRQHAVPLAIALATLAALPGLAAADERGDRAGDVAGRPPSTLNRPKTPTASPDAEGFIRRWLVLEPIPAAGLTQDAVRAAVKAETMSNQTTAIPKDGDSVDVKGSRLTWNAEETTEYNVNLYHFARSLKKRTSNALFWAVTVVHCPAEMKDVRLAIGSNAASVWWVNGREVVGLYGDRQTVIDDGVSKRLTLKKGPNVVRCAVVNGAGATDFCARFLDQDGAPVRAFTVSLDDREP
ncbi:hypothetical protein OJF2_40470 [Aquisphaera giovannonii]|uniref:Acetylxylan esterase n=1 Tax=Aquisphaera giovannonii TaxID=406548 RepID=A0A5B9W5V1_9BACT|nr:acetylxylan esterase [Aquisphaera giovannonii]QEH35495.1 hypothetical protein OJF2_40470 [Aquisphaera giovannonii]